MPFRVEFQGARCEGETSLNTLKTSMPQLSYSLFSLTNEYDFKPFGHRGVYCEQVNKVMVKMKTVRPHFCRTMMALP